MLKYWMISMILCSTLLSFGQEEGLASFYADKFQGSATASGEKYDKDLNTAAHKTHPFGTILRVTNSKNGKNVIVRVNDRGPFHSGRVIDLSYAAALKLDVLKTGVIDVKIDVIHVDKTGKVTVGRLPIIPKKAPKNISQQLYIQIVALQNKTQILKLAKDLQNLYSGPFKTKFEKGIYKLHLGPFNNKHEADRLLIKLKSNHHPSAFKIYSD